MHSAIKKRQFASEYLAIHDRQIIRVSYKTHYSVHLNDLKAYLACGGGIYLLLRRPPGSVAGFY